MKKINMSRYCDKFNKNDNCLRVKKQEDINHHIELSFGSHGMCFEGIIQKYKSIKVHKSMLWSHLEV